MNSAYTLDFAKYSGKGIKEAIIDSGIDECHYLPNIVFRKDFTSTSATFKANKICKDLIGHGTACTGIISEKAPDAELLIIKIFDIELITSYKLLLNSLIYAIEQGAHVINLSLGIYEKFNSLRKLYDICNYAYENNIIIVSSENNLTGESSYPANFDNVIGVTSGEIHSKYGYLYRENNSIELIAKGDWQRVNWLMGESIFRAGSSLAASHISGIISLVLQAFPNSSFKKVKKILLSNFNPICNE